MALKNLDVWNRLREKFPGFDFEVVSQGSETSREKVKFINLPLRRSIDPKKHGSAPTLIELEKGPVSDFLTGSDLQRHLSEVARRQRYKRHERRQAGRRSRRVDDRYSFY